MHDVEKPIFIRVQRWFASKDSIITGSGSEQAHRELNRLDNVARLKLKIRDSSTRRVRGSEQSSKFHRRETFSNGTLVRISCEWCEKVLDDVVVKNLSRLVQEPYGGWPMFNIAIAPTDVWAHRDSTELW